MKKTILYLSVIFILGAFLSLRPVSVLGLSISESDFPNLALEGVNGSEFAEIPANDNYPHIRIGMFVKDPTLGVNEVNLLDSSAEFFPENDSELNSYFVTHFWNHIKLEFPTHHVNTIMNYNIEITFKMAYGLENPDGEIHYQHNDAKNENMPVNRGLVRWAFEFGSNIVAHNKDIGSPAYNVFYQQVGDHPEGTQFPLLYLKSENDVGKLFSIIHLTDVAIEVANKFMIPNSRVAIKSDNKTVFEYEGWGVPVVNPLPDYRYTNAAQSFTRTLVNTFILDPILSAYNPDMMYYDDPTWGGGSGTTISLKDSVMFANWIPDDNFSSGQIKTKVPHKLVIKIKPPNYLFFHGLRNKWGINLLNYSAPTSLKVHYFRCHNSFALSGNPPTNKLDHLDTVTEWEERNYSTLLGNILKVYGRASDGIYQSGMLTDDVPFIDIVGANQEGSNTFNTAYQTNQKDWGYRYVIEAVYPSGSRYSNLLVPKDASNNSILCGSAVDDTIQLFYTPTFGSDTITASTK